MEEHDSDAWMIPKTDNQIAIHHLSTLLTNHSFDENPLKTFQSDVSNALVQMGMACTLIRDITISNQGVHTIHSTWLEQCLEQLNWEELIEQRDIRVMRLQQSTTPTNSSTTTTCHNFLSPFDVLLSCWKDPTVWPPVCNASLIKVIFKQLMFHRSGNQMKGRTIIRRSGRYDWSSTNLLLLDFAMTILKQQPSLLSSSSLPSLIELLRNNLQSVHSDHETINVTISIVKELIRNFRSKSICFIPLFLDLICAITARINSLNQSRWTSTNESKPSLQKKVVTHGTNLAILHGESSDQEEEIYQNKLLLRLARMNKFNGYGQRSGGDYKRILNSNTESMTQDRISHQIMFLSVLRTKCLKSLLSSSMDYSIQINQESMNQVLLVTILTLIASRPGLETIYIRLSAVLWVNKSSHPKLVYQLLIQMIWSRIMEYSNDPRPYLSFYVEILIESSFFDEQTFLTDAVQPLCDHVQNVILDQNTAKKENRDIHHFPQVILHSIAFLLAYRGRMLLQLPVFKFLLARLSVEFTSPKQWVLPNTISSAERLKLITSLKTSELFGIDADDDEDDDEEREEKGSQCMNTSSWFYDPHQSFTIRACQGLSTSLVSSQLFSHWSPTNSEPTCHTHGGRCGERISSPVKDGIPLGDLGDDILREIFSFLGFKRIVFNRQVCKRWKNIGDDEFNTWQPLYIGRFGIDLEDPMLGASSTLPWKQLFIQRWKAEKEIRFKRDKTGWRWRLCSRIGCLTVHTSRARLLKHQSTHEVKSNKRKRTSRETSRAKR